MAADGQVRIVKVPDASLRVAIQEGAWGAHTALFKKWHVGDYILFLTSEGLAAVARVAGAPFESDLMIWEGAVYPHRIPIAFETILSPEARMEAGKKVREILLNELGSGYGMRILRQSALPREAAEPLLRVINTLHESAAGNLLGQKLPRD